MKARGAFRPREHGPARGLRGGSKTGEELQNDLVEGIGVFHHRVMPNARQNDLPHTSNLSLQVVSYRVSARKLALADDDEDRLGDLVEPHGNRTVLLAQSPRKSRRTLVHPVPSRVVLEHLLQTRGDSGPV